jgi:hypothetical protein
MQIKELVKILSAHHNQDAQVVVNINTTNIDDEQDDIRADLIVFDQDEFYNDFIELLVVPTQRPLIKIFDK